MFTPSLRSRAQWLVYLLGGLLSVSVLNTGTSFWAFKFLEKKAKHPIHGLFIPNPLSPSFTLKSPSFDWRGKFQVNSGTFRVRYNPIFFLLRQKFRVQIEGRKVGVRILGELAQSQGFSDVKVDRLEADLAFPRKGTLEIFSFDVRSPQMEFHIARKEQNLD